MFGFFTLEPSSYVIGNSSVIYGKLCSFVILYFVPKTHEITPLTIEKRPCDIVRSSSSNIVSNGNINRKTLYTKGGKKPYFPDFLVYSKVYLEPSKASVMEVFCENSGFEPLSGF